MTDTPLTPERIRADVERILGEQPGTVPGGENLLDLGMDSIRLMSLVESWRTAGAQTDFIELAEEPSIDAWTRLLTGG
ncbi:phosphopantetheine-binding protein [Nocardiopsis composta]|uniref:Aryl carrier-like protein n=1 Tax=Nocardiopsis composta TaxID=157465 RepID=A0A7W8VD64_9ACTN|nr:phosphopantetheine-binding protein [Nocardiopsis composta]MBB5431663.1 aryl carrier-like protein [Nocardiopsis composta]